MKIICKGLSIFIAGLCLCGFTELNDSEVTTQRDYWPNGNIKECRKYDAHGKILAKGFCHEDGTVQKLERYDKDGKKVEESYYNEKEELKEGIDGWAARRRVYLDGVMREERYYGENGKIKERRNYSESGMLIRKQLVGDPDVDGNESYAPLKGYGREIIEEYDASGKLLRRAKAAQ